jgi:hypothetical protein
MKNHQPINLWLDDIRPAPSGWTWVKTIEDAWELLSNSNVQSMSLDHDLGVCTPCSEKLEQGENIFCTHIRSGYDLCLMMAEHNRWSREKPTVHSQNPVGAERMPGVIERYFIAADI